MSGGYARGNGTGPGQHASPNGSANGNGSGRPQPRLISCGFNQEQTCIAVATSAGFRILNCDPFAKCYEFTEGGVSLVEMLHSTSLLALVGAGEQAAFSPRRLRMLNTKSGKYICELNFVSTVLQVRLSYSHLLAVLERKIHIFDLRSMKMIHSLDTAPNPRGLCALSAGGGAAEGPHVAPGVGAQQQHAFLCYPASDERGELFVYDALNLRTVACIRAHNTPLRTAAFNATGTALATCSMQGTVIRVFAIPSGRKLFSFRRGTYPAKINTLAFNRSGDMLVVSSDDSSTVHVFSMRDPPPPADPTHGSSSSSSSSAADSPADGNGFSSGGGGGGGGANSGGISSSAPSPSSFLGSTSSAAGAMLASVANSSAVALARGSAVAAAAAGVSGALSFLPHLVQDLVEPARHFAHVALKDNAIPLVSAFGPGDTLLIATRAGHLSVYSLPSPSSASGAAGGAAGGACKLESEHPLLDQPSEAIGTRLVEEQHHMQHQQQHGGGGGQQGLMVQDIGFDAQESHFALNSPQRKR